MKKIALFVLSSCCLNATAQTDSLRAMEEILSFQKTLNAEYGSKEESPLEPKDFKRFRGHSFFPINLAYRVQGALTVTAGTPFLPMKTTTTRLGSDRVYGYVEFALAGKTFKIPVYQSQELIKKEEYADYLFFPFTDLTNGKQTYMGGRYIDLRIPKEGQELVIDFNQAYNPYCAYSHKYSCPLVPAENQLNVEVPAGVMYSGKK
jgi:uncharacterized protein (DUF1684 family)